MRGSNTGYEFLDRAINACLYQMNPQEAHKLAQTMLLTFPTPLTIDQEPVRKKPFRKLMRPGLITVPLKEGNQTYELYDKPAYYR